VKNREPAFSVLDVFGELRRSEDGGVAKLRTVADQLEASRRAWEEAGHRGALVDALRICRAEAAPLPEWLARAVEEAVIWWTRKAPTAAGKKGGRHANFPVKRREIVAHLQRADFYHHEVARGLPPTQAKAMTAEWFHVDEKTIGESLAKVKRMHFGTRYLALDDRWQTVAWLRQPNAKAEIRRWSELERRYAPWRKATPTTPR
jgi:hypothetical protein